MTYRIEYCQGCLPANAGDLDWRRMAMTGGVDYSSKASCESHANWLTAETNHQLVTYRVVDAEVPQ